MRRITQADLAAQVTQWESRQFLTGLARHRTGDHIGAMRKYKKILDKNPRCWPALMSASVLAHHLCQHQWAIHHLRRITNAVPGFLEAWFNLGTILQCVGQYEEAEQTLRKALELDQTFVGAWTNLGNALLGLGRTEEADATFRMALQYQPQDAEANWNLAHVLILSGDWIQGWAKYEYRWQIPGFVEMNAIAVDETRGDLPLPWRGADLRGKTLVVAEEQGWGDTIMCLRYAPFLREMGVRTIWAVRPELIRLAALTVAPDAVCSIREPVPASDYIVAAMTLHHRLGITPERIPYSEGYLRVA